MAVCIEERKLAIINNIKNIVDNCPDSISFTEGKILDFSESVYAFDNPATSGKEEELGCGASESITSLNTQSADNKHIWLNETFTVYESERTYLIDMDIETLVSLLNFVKSHIQYASNS